MSDKKVIIKKTYGTSWLSTIGLCIIVGLIGAILGNASGQALMGFIVGIVMVLISELLVLACCIPFVGIYFYWVWSCWFYDWIIRIAFAGNETLINNFAILSLVPLIIFAFFGVIICVILSIFAVVFIGAIIGAIFSR